MASGIVGCNPRNRWLLDIMACVTFNKVVVRKSCAWRLHIHKVDYINSSVDQVGVLHIDRIQPQTYHGKSTTTRPQGCTSSQLRHQVCVTREGIISANTHNGLRQRSLHTKRISMSLHFLTNLHGALLSGMSWKVRTNMEICSNGSQPSNYNGFGGSVRRNEKRSRCVAIIDSSPPLVQFYYAIIL